MDWLALQDEEKLPDLKAGDELAVIEVRVCPYHAGRIEQYFNVPFLKDHSGYKKWGQRDEDNHNGMRSST